MKTMRLTHRRTSRSALLFPGAMGFRPPAVARLFSPPPTSNMTPIQIAALLLRLFSVYLCLDIILVLTELPPNIYGIINSQSDYLTHQRALILLLELVRLVIYAGLAITFLVFNRPLAKFFVKGLESLKSDDEP